MKNFLKKALIGFGLIVSVMASGQILPVNTANATGTGIFNRDPQDFPVLEVSNYTRCPNSASCWSSSISGVQAGETIAFVFYAHNTGDADAANTRVALNLTTSGSQMNGYGRISADNAATVARNVRIDFASDVRTPVTLTFVGGEYYKNSTQSPTTPDPLPGGQTVRQVGSGGVNIGTLPHDALGTYTNDMQLVLRYRVDGGTAGCSLRPTFRITPDTATVRVGETAQYQAIYDSNGDCAGGETDVTNSASWNNGTDYAAVADSLGQGRYRGTRRGTGTVVATYSGLSDTATINVTDNGGGCTSSGATLNVTPSRDTIDVGDTASYRAIYDSNGDCAGGESDVTNSASWSINNSSIASNQDDGDFRGREAGTATVRATYSGLSDTATLRVNDDNGGGSCDNDRETLVIVPYTASFGVGQTYQYRALFDADGPGCSGAERDVTNSASWSSNSSNIAVSQGSGSFRGVTTGFTGIEARYSGITATAQANVSGGNNIVLPPTYTGGGTVVLPTNFVGGGTVRTGGIVSGVATSGVSCITVTPSVDVTSMLPGQDFVYTTLYRNDCPFALDNAVLRVFIPNDVEFKASSNPFFIREGQKFSYNLGILPPGGQGSVAISGDVRKDARLGDTETFTSSIEFLDANGRIQGTASYLVAVLGGDIRRTMTANISDALGHIFGSAWLWILILLLVLAGIIWFIVAMFLRRRSTHTVATKVAVAPNDDPLRALRNA